MGNDTGSVTGDTAMDIHAVLLDVGGVFLVPDPEPIARITGADGGDEQVIRAHYGAINDADDGRTFDWGLYHRLLATHCGVPESMLDAVAMQLSAHFQRRNTWVRPLPGARDALAALARTGRTLAIVSNSDGTVEQTLRELELCQVGDGPGTEVELVVDSCAVGVSKPDPEIFRLALASIGVEPGNAVHVGDTRFADVAGALAAGVRPVHVDPYGDCPEPDAHQHVPNVGAVPALLLG